ncbi:MAG: MCE family protein [Ignavibacteriales bacterium]|nr:MAG: MCE family protein [Ignavibacteriales bacterium]
MKDQRKTEIKIGITVVVALVALIWIFGWAKNYKIYAGQKKIDVEFETASGLEKGDPVMVNGVRKGFVDEIVIHGNNAIIKIVLDPDVTIKEDALIAISMLDLMGGKKVEIKPGVAAKEIDYSKLQKGVFYADIPAVMAMLGSVQNDLINIIKDIQVTLGSMNKFLTDKEFTEQIKTSIQNLTEVSKKLNVMIDENRSNFKQLTKNATELTSEATQFIKENKDNIHSTIEETKLVIQNSNELVTKISSLLDETKDKKNNVGKILYDESLINELKTSLENVKELTRILLDQLKNEGINVDANIDLF